MAGARGGLHLFPHCRNVAPDPATLPHAARAGVRPAPQVPRPWNRAARRPLSGRERVGDAGSGRGQVAPPAAAASEGGAVAPNRAAVGTDDSSGVRIASYDFGFAGRLSREQVAAVGAVHETFARLAAESLANHTRAPVELHPHSVAQITADEFRAWLPRAGALAGVALDPLAGVALLAVDQRFAFALLDRLLGGRGAPSVPARALSEIEHSVLQNRIAGLLPHLQSAWQPVVPLRPRLAYCGGRGHAAAVAPAGMLVRVAFTAAIGRAAGEMQVAIPCLALKSIRPIGARRGPRPRRPTAQLVGRRAALRAALQGVRVPVSAEIGSARLPLPRILALRKGDLIRLDDRRPGDELFLKVGGHPVFRCRPGVAGKRRAVQVVRPLAGAAEAAQ